MILIDANALVVLLVGLIDIRLLKNHKRTSIYEEQDFYDLVNVIGDFSRLVTLPNVWTEADNLLNSFGGEYRYSYIQIISDLIKQTSEKFIPSSNAIQNHHFIDIGLTDSLLLEHSKECTLLITSDSKLSDFALSYGVIVYDLVKNRNERI